MKKFVIVADIHGNHADPQATAAALAFTKDFNPEIRVIAGDLWDFSAIRQGASEEDRSISMRDDFDVGARFADSFFKGGKENTLMLGNHDVRAWDLAESTDAVKADLGQRMVKDIQMVAKRNKASLIPYDSRLGVVSIGHLNVVHGFHTGMSACAAHSRIYGNVVFGHCHSIESYQTPGLKPQEARCIGCLCDLNPGYANRKTGKLRWSHGWVYGWVEDDGSYSIFQVRGINGKFRAPTNIKTY
jgi:predicted phosphodiesterase